MMLAYLDASVLVPTLTVEATTVPIFAFLARTDVQPCCSDFAAAEVASALSRATRLGLLQDEEAQERLNGFDFWRRRSTQPVSLETTDVAAATAFVRRFDLGLRAPDAIHAAICHRIGANLVTLDRRLASAARTLGIEVVLPAA